MQSHSEKEDKETGQHLDWRAGEAAVFRVGEIGNLGMV